MAGYSPTTFELVAPTKEALPQLIGAQFYNLSDPEEKGTLKALALLHGIIWVVAHAQLSTNFTQLCMDGCGWLKRTKTSMLETGGEVLMQCHDTNMSADAKKAQLKGIIMDSLEGGFTNPLIV